MKRFLTLVFVLGLTFTINSTAQWVKLDNGLGNNNVSDMTFDRNNIFASTNHGIFFSSDNGSSWESKGLNDFSMLTITMTPNYIFAGSYNDGLYLSTDYGKSWVCKGFNGEGMFKDDTCINHSVSNRDVVVVSSVENGLFLSTDHGKSWRKPTVYFPKSAITDLAISDDKIYAGFNGDGVYLSTDNGMNWTAKNSNPNNLNITSLSVYDNEVLTGTSNKGIFLSYDKGDTWIEKNSGLDYKSITDVVKIGKNYFYSYYHGVYISLNDAVSWKRDFSIIDSRDVKKFYIKENYIFASTSYGLYRSKLVDLGVTDIDGIELSKTIKIIVTPNPAKEFIEVTPFVDLDNAVISITDFSGKVYKSQNIPYLAKFNSFGIDTREFSWGMYFCIVRSGSCSGSFQFMIQK